MSDLWDNDEPYLVVGIDFGTTFSGIAWALSTKPKDVDIITGWDSEIDHNEGSAKVPTRISYSKHGNISSWGFDHDNQDRQLSWFKLLLCEETKKRAASQRTFLNKLEEDMKSLNKSAVDVAADYLHRLWGHTTSVLRSKFGKAFFEDIQIKLVLTIPAIWDHQAQEMTRAAARKAGMMNRHNTKLELVSEPEAAARYVFGENLSLKVGDAFVVCDAGGGTIDLISYKVEKLNPLRLEMCSEAAGDLYGAVFLDNAFERTVKEHIGEEAYEALSVRNKKKMMGDWEHGIKRTFKHGHRAEKDWVVDIPGYSGIPSSPPPYSPASSTSSRSSAAILTPQTTGSTLNGGMRGLSITGRRGRIGGGEPGVINIKTTDLESIFGEVCPRITQLVRTQIETLNKSSIKPKAIFLVGGFGANKYLKEELQNSFRSIEIQQPKDAWSAICRGAVLKGMSDETVVNHIAKYHYGINFQEKFDSRKHDAQDKVWDMVECEWKAHRQMRWYISRGDNISKSDPVRYNWYQALTDRDQLSEVDTTIYYCTPLIAPKRRTADVLKLCKLTAHFLPSVWEELPEETNLNGLKYRKLSYTIEMRVSSSGLDWMLHYEGQEKGRATIAIDYTGQNPGWGWETPN